MGVTVRDLQAAKAFYDAAFAPLGVAVVMSVSAEETGGAAFIGYGPTEDRRDIQAGKPSFWVSQGEGVTGPMHVAFLAEIGRAHV